MAEPEDLKWALESLRERVPRYHRFYNYYEGEQDLAFATEKFRKAFARLFDAFACNRCEAVVDAHADRMQVAGFQGRNKDEEIGELAQAVWDANRMDKRSGEVHKEMFLAGDAYVIVDQMSNPGPSDPEVVLWPQRADEVTVRYDKERPGRIALAAKAWRADDKRWRVNLYYPDRTEKFVTRSVGRDFPTSLNTLVEFDDPRNGGSVVSHGWDQVPVFHFANNARTGAFGSSELKSIIPLQDALNKTLADLIVSGEFQAFRQRYAIGVTPEIDPETGQPKAAFTQGAGELWMVGAPDAKFGDFAEADIQKFDEAAESWDLRISRTSRVPSYYLGLSRDLPSGESLKSADAPFATKMTDRQTATGNDWEDALAFGLRLMTGRQDIALECLWKSAALRSERDTWEVAGLKSAVGVPNRQLWSEGGYSKEQVDEFEDAERESQARAAAALGNALARQGEIVEQDPPGTEDQGNEAPA